MKTLVIYSSVSGYTKQYAKWIAEGLNCEAKDIKAVDVTTLNEYDCIIFGGCIYASKIRDLKLIKDNLSSLKKVIVFSTGLLADEKSVESFKTSNFDESMLKRISYYHLLGGVDLKKLNFVSRTILSIVGKSIGSKNGEKVDFSNPIFLGSKEAIFPIIEEVKVYEKSLVK